MITVFTPTYNRANNLERLFVSLSKQTNFDFEWLVIDDGSSDNTPQQIEQFSRQAIFPVRYYRQENGGKHRAYNLALELAAGEWFLCVDSDDWLPEDAIFNLNRFLINCSVSIVAAYKSDVNGKILSDAFPDGGQACTLSDLEFLYNCVGEFSLLFKTAYVSRFLSPTFEGESFMTEAVVYDRMAKDGMVWLFPHIITVCEYQPDGLTSNIQRIMKNNPAGFCLYFMQRIDLQKNIAKRWITAGKYLAFCSFAKEKRSVYTGAHRLLVVLAKPLGLLFRYYYVLFRGF